MAMSFLVCKLSQNFDNLVRNVHDPQLHFSKVGWRNPKFYFRAEMRASECVKMCAQKYPLLYGTKQFTAGRGSRRNNSHRLKRLVIYDCECVEKSSSKIPVAQSVLSFTALVSA